MVNIVVVSHSALLAQGVAQLAQQMTQGGCQLAIAAGVDDEDHPIGTDAIKVMEAIESVYDPSGVLVLMDLGSALLSAETALDLLDPEIAQHVLLCAAPLVEGTLAAVVAASAGRTLQQVKAEAVGALAAKISQLGEQPADAQVPENLTPAPDSQSVSWTVLNPNGLHVRPAAKLVEALAPFDAELLMEKDGRCVNPRSLNQLAILQVRKGDTLRLLASGKQAAQALAAFMDVAAQGFGENIDSGERHVLTGIAVLPAPVCAQIRQIQPLRAVFRPETVAHERIAEQQQRVRVAIAATLEDLQQLALRAEQRIGAEQAAIFNAHAMLLDDEDLLHGVEMRIEQESLCAEAALQAEFLNMASDYLALEDEYLRVRELDVRDILNRLLGHLTGLPVTPLPFTAAGLLLTDELFPSEMIDLDRKIVKGICLSHGSALSHAAILSRALGIPMLVGVNHCLDVTHHGQSATLDVQAGTLTLHVE